MNSLVFDACLASMAERYKLAATDEQDPLQAPGPVALGAALGFTGDAWHGLVQRFRDKSAADDSPDAREEKKDQALRNFGAAGLGASLGIQGEGLRKVVKGLRKGEGLRSIDRYSNKRLAGTTALTLAGIGLQAHADRRKQKREATKTAFLASVGKAVIGAGVKRGITRGVTSKVTQGLRGAGLSREGVQKAVGGATLGAGALGVGAAGYAAG